MSQGIEGELREFATQVLERRGSVVEWPEEEPAGVAAIDAATARALHVPEDLLSLSSSTESDAGLRVNLAGDFLDVMGRLLEDEPRVAVLRIPDRYLKRKGLDEAVSRTFTWPNAKVQVGTGEAQNVEYHSWWFHAVLVSEDRWETRFAFTLNARSGGRVPLPDILLEWDLEADEPVTDEEPATFPIASRLAVQEVPALASEFLRRLDGRLTRDRKRLNEYYGALARESGRPKGRRYDVPDPEKLAAHKRAVQLELRRKLAELEDRYAVAATIQPLALIRVRIPAMVVPLIVHRRQARREHLIYWNPMLKQFEAMPCRRCGRGTFVVSFTNDTVDALCTMCSG